MTTSHTVGLLAIASCLCGGNQSYAQSARNPVLIPASVDKVFVPLGFDDNDNAEVIIHGRFPNTCYKTGPASATVDYAQKKILIKASSYLYSGVMCGQVMVPYIQSIKFGIVNVGDYSIEVEGSPQAVTTSLKIAAHVVDTPDDYLYANVETASLDVSTDGTQSLTLTGTNPLPIIGCIVLQEIRTNVTPGNVLVTQPISSFENGPICNTPEGAMHFSKTIRLPERVHGEGLIHVRVMDGESFNRLFEMPQ